MMSSSPMAMASSRILKGIVLIAVTAMSLGSNIILYKYTDPKYDEVQFEETVTKVEQNFLLTSFGTGAIFGLDKIIDKWMQFQRFMNMGMGGGYGGGYSDYGSSYGSSGMGYDFMTTIFDWLILFCSVSAVLSSSVVLGYKYVLDLGDDTWKVVGNGWRTYALVAMAINVLTILSGLMYIFIYMKKQQPTGESNPSALDAARMAEQGQ